MSTGTARCAATKRVLPRNKRERERSEKRRTRLKNAGNGGMTMSAHCRRCVTAHVLATAPLCARGVPEKEKETSSACSISSDGGCGGVCSRRFFVRHGALAGARPHRRSFLLHTPAWLSRWASSMPRFFSPPSCCTMRAETSHRKTESERVWGEKEGGRKEGHTCAHASVVLGLLALADLRLVAPLDGLHGAL